MDSSNPVTGNQQTPSRMLVEPAPNTVSNETASHIRNLILKSNVTITAAPNKPKAQNEPQKKRREIPEAANETTSQKKPKIAIEYKTDRSTSFNPLKSLPLSLISNGTLSVTSESSCVTIENGVPILKEIIDGMGTAAVPEKQSTNMSVATIAPVESTTSDRIQPKNNNNNTDEHSGSLKDTPSTKGGSLSGSKDLMNDNKQAKNAAPAQDKFSINKIILKSLTDVVKENSLIGKVGLIPNPNQMYFLTLLGLENVVDSCCRSNDVHEYAEKTRRQRTPLQCGQCRTDFTTNWHFYRNPLKVLCDRCFLCNQKQIIKAAQTVRLAKEYSRLHQLKRSANGAPKASEEKEKFNSNQSSSMQEENRLFQNFINAAALSSKDNCVSDLTVLGAAIASNNEIFDAAKAVNSLDSNAAPLLRAMVVQNFQIALFKGLQQRIALPSQSSDGNVNMQQDQALLYYQKVVAQMMTDASVMGFQSQSHSSDAPLAAIVRAAEAQHQNLLKTIFKQTPKS